MKLGWHHTVAISQKNGAKFAQKGCEQVQQPNESALAHLGGAREDAEDSVERRRARVKLNRRNRAWQHLELVDALGRRTC
jgi:hypothetical protein